MIDLKPLLDSQPNCLASRATLRSYLLDMFPNEKRSANIVASIYECGIAQKIQAMNFLADYDVQKFVSQLDWEYGIASKYATDYIFVWADAYDVPYSTSQLKTGSEHKPVIQKQTLSDLAAFFEMNGFEVIDKRKAGGCLWVVGDRSKLEPHVKKAKELFSITDGGYAKGRATAGRHGWYTSSKK